MLAKSGVLEQGNSEPSFLHGCNPDILKAKYSVLNKHTFTDEDAAYAQI